MLGPNFRMASIPFMSDPGSMITTPPPGGWGAPIATGYAPPGSNPIPSQTFNNPAPSPHPYYPGGNTVARPAAAPQNQPSQSQTPSQNQQSDQPAPKQPQSVQAPASPGTNYGYGPQPTYGAAPIAPTYAPPPQALDQGVAPVAPTVVRGMPAPAQAPAQVQAPVFMPRQTIISTPPINPLHAAIQDQMSGGSFQSPFFAEATARRRQGYPSQ